jgi:hypothetical protein
MNSASTATAGPSVHFRRTLSRPATTTDTADSARKPATATSVSDRRNGMVAKALNRMAASGG